MTDHASEMDLDPGRLVVLAQQPQAGRLLSFPLQLSDRTLVAPGQRVEPGQALVERFREQETIEIPTTAAVVGLRPGDFIDHVPAQQGGRLGRRSQLPARRARVIDHGRDGQTRLAAGRGDIVVHAPTGGVVETLLPGRMDIRAEALAVDASVGWGRPAAGRLLVAAEGPDSEMPASRIDIAAAGAILVVGARLDVEAMSRARAIGVAAVISGGVAGRDLRQLAESEVRQQAALHAAAPFGLLALEGYGRLPIARHRWDLLVAADGRPAGILPASRTLLITGDATPLAEAIKRPLGTVRITSGEQRDRVGRLVGLAGQRYWADGSYAPGGFVETAGRDGHPERLCVPLTMLERLG